MNLSSDENNLPLFKYSPEISSQLLIQTNDSHEYVQIPNICDDLLLTDLEDGTITWTLGGMPILLNGQNDSQQLLLNSAIAEESFESLQPQQEMLNNILDDVDSPEPFQESIAEDANSEIVLPLELPERSFLTESGLFITSEGVNDQINLAANYQLVNNDEENELHNLPTETEQTEPPGEDEIQSSDISSQETFIDINGLLIPQQTVLKLNQQDLLLPPPDVQTNFITLNTANLKNKKRKAIITKRKIKKSKNEILMNALQKLTTAGGNATTYLGQEETEQNSLLNINQPVNNLKIINLDGPVTFLNVDDGTTLSNKALLRGDSNILTFDASKINELHDMGIRVDNEPDSTTTTNDTEEILNIDELANIVQTYQCKKCEFSCNDREQFLAHFKDFHLAKPPIALKYLDPSRRPLKAKAITLQQISKLFQKSNLNFQFVPKEQVEFVRDIGMSTESPLDISILNHIENNCDNNISPQSETAIEPNLMNSEILTNENLTLVNVEEEKKSTVAIENIDIDEPEEPQNNFEPISMLYPGLTLFVEQEETEKKIMRVKRKGKAAKPKETFDYSKIQYLAKNDKKNISILSSSAQQQAKKSTTYTFLPGLEHQNATEADLKKLPTIYMCATCNSQFPNVDACKDHYVKVHKYANQAEEPAEINGIKTEDDSAENKKILEKFFSQDVMKKRKHKCPIKGCQYRFAKIELLKRHEACHINGTRSPFNCPECKEHFPSWRTCSIHLWKCHKVDIDFYTCPLCDYKGSTYDKIKHHVKIHSEERDYVCRDCGRSFKQPTQLRNHRVIHLDKRNILNTPRWFVQQHCEICGKIFSESKTLRKHIQAVHSKLKPFICNVCGHSCARKAMLQLHLRQHTGDKPYSCSLCMYKTGDHNSLRRHTMRHTGNRPYKCPYCDYAAIQSNSYKHHVATKHPGKSGFFECTECGFKSINEEIFNSHKNDHKIGLITALEEIEQTDINSLHTISLLNPTKVDIPNDPEHGLFTSGQLINNVQDTHKNSFELEDDETQNCLFSSLGDLADEPVDTGGITIPAEPENSLL